MEVFGGLSVCSRKDSQKDDGPQSYESLVGTRPRRAEPERIALELDLENLASDYRRARAWSSAAKALGELMDFISTRGEVVICVAVCDRRLARDLGPKLERYGITTLPHRGGPDEADRMLSQILRTLTRLCSTVIIGSGDHAFAEEARRLRLKGKRVEAVAPPGAISAELYRAVDEFHEFPLKAQIVFPEDPSRRPGSISWSY